ncbi:hypothetical protein BS17DRAFT_776631 [Gyrodon lividus]|nr:hypothetical protein BS17DRAFT_776631 [Gyrodon lividus]
MMIKKVFPIFKLAWNGWKLDLLCGNDYPGWVRNNVDSEGNWHIEKGIKCEEDSGEAMSGRRKRKGKRSTSEGAKKKIKGKHVFK